MTRNPETEPAIFLCSPARPAADRPVPGTKVIPCSGCQRPVMISPATMMRPEAREKTARFLCFDCARPHFPDIAEVVAPTEAQRAELKAAGVDPDHPFLAALWGKR